MCHEHQGHREGRGFGRGGLGPPGGGRGFRGFGRGGFPTRDEWVERLEAHRERLEQDLANVRDLIERLGDGPAPEPSA